MKRISENAINGWHLSGFICVVLSMVGVFLPWGVWTWSANIYSLNNYFCFGFEVLTGPFALACCLLIVISLMWNAKHLERSRRGVLSGEFFVAFLSLLWIFGSRFLSWVWKVENWSLLLSGSLSSSYLAPTFGAFITCISSLIVLSLILWHKFLVPSTNFETK